MRSRPRSMAALRSCVAAAFAATLLVEASAQTSLGLLTTTYKASGLSIWRNGGGQQQFSPAFLGPTWDFGPTSFGSIVDLRTPSVDLGAFTIPSVDLGNTGAVFNIQSTGRLGFWVTPAVANGTLSFTYNAALNIESSNPLPDPGSSVTVSAVFEGLQGSSFNTTSPSFGLGFGAGFRVKANSNFEIAFLGNDSGVNTLLNFDVGSDASSTSLSNGIVWLQASTVSTLINDLNVGVSDLNPLPVTPSIYVPDTSTSTSYVNPDNTMNASKYGQFLDMSTDFLSWVAALAGPEADAINKIFQGDYILNPALTLGGNLEVSWAIARAYCDMNFGLNENFTLSPAPVVSMDVYDDFGKLLAHSNSAKVTFNMPKGDSNGKPLPNGGVRIVPTLATSFFLENKFSFGMGGDIGITPVEVKANGAVGTGVSAIGVDYDFNPAQEQYAISGPLDTISDDKIKLNAGVEAPVTMPGLEVLPANNYQLPPAIYTKDSNGNFQSSAVVTAFVADQAGSENPAKTITLALKPAQGFHFFAGSIYTATLVGPNGFSLSLGAGNQTSFTLDITIPDPGQNLAPGAYTLVLGDSATVAGGARASSTYTLPVYAIYGKPILGNTIYALDQNGLLQNVNVCPSDGQDHTFSISATTGVYTSASQHSWADTKLFLDYGAPGAVELPYVFPGTISSGGQVNFTIPATLARRLGGSGHQLQMLNPASVTDSTGVPTQPILSDPIPVYFWVDNPLISTVTLDGSNSSVLPVTAQDEWIVVRGANMAASATAMIKELGVPLTVVYTEPTVPIGSPAAPYLKVRIPATMQRQVLAKNPPFTLVVSTPFLQIPADSQHPDETSGGTSTSPLTFGLAAPHINSVAPSEVIRGVDTTLTVNGSGLYNPSQSAWTPKGTVIKIGGSVVDTSNLRFRGPDQTFPTSVVVSLRGNASPMTKTGAFTLSAFNGDFKSNSRVSVVNAVPAVQSVSPSQVRVGPNNPHATLSILGGGFYPETEAFINGTRYAPTFSDFQHLAVSVSTSSLPDARTVSAYLLNPAPGGGPGDKFTITLIERDTSKISVVRGPFTFDRKSNTWRQTLTLAYNGHRVMNGILRLYFGSLATGVTLGNADGTDAKGSYKTITMTDGNVGVVKAIFTRAGGAQITYTPSLVFVN